MRRVIISPPPVLVCSIVIRIAADIPVRNRKLSSDRGIESSYAWTRLFVSLALMTIGSSGMYTVVVALPVVEAEFGVSRADASLPYTMTMIFFAVGGVVMGSLADRYGVMMPALASAFALAAGYILGGSAATLWQFSLAQGILLGLLGASGTFAPLVADTSLWFSRRRGIAVAICASGNYMAGTLWPPITQFFIDLYGWRATYVGFGIFCILSMLPLALVLRPRAPTAAQSAAAAASVSRGTPESLGLTPNGLQALLCLAGIACCVAMSMPQVHIVAYCTDLGFAAARGAEMLSLMMATGIVSRLVSGLVADRIGGLRTLFAGSALQTLALVLYVPSDGLVSLYVVSALFGLFQGGIVPCYALVVREYFPPSQAGVRVAAALMATLLGMALGGWLNGAIFDLTGSYRVAFLNGIAWNVLNMAIIGWLIWRAGGARRAPARESRAY